MQFQSKASAYQVLIRPELKKWSPDGMVLLDTIPALTAKFGDPGPEYRYQNPLTGEWDVTVQGRGHFFDSLAAQEENGWTDDEREMVEKVLVGLCNKTPEYIWLYEEAKHPAPWPTYDTTHHNQIPVLAEQLGLVDAALAYERQNKERPAVIEKLEALVAQDQAEEELTAA